MKTALGLMLGLTLLGSTGCSAATHDFDSVVAGVEQRYSVHAQRVPLMGFISLCARATSRGGVKDMRIADFDHIGNLDADGFYSMMQSELGAEWHPMVRQRSGTHSAMSVIFVRPSEESHDSMRMMIADYDNGELSLVRMDMNGPALAKWMRNPQAHEGVFHLRNSTQRQTD